MKKAAPAIQNLARRLLTLEAEHSAPKEAGAAAMSVLARFRDSLMRLVGLAGFQALLARALALAKAEVNWLQTVQVSADAVMEGLQEAAQQQSPQAAEEGSAALISQLISLLVTFIGGTLTLKLIREMWPDEILNESYLHNEETPV